MPRPTIASTAQHLAHGSTHGLVTTQDIAARVVDALRDSGEDGWIVGDWAGGFFNATRYYPDSAILIGITEDTYGPARFVVAVVAADGSLDEDHVLTPEQPLSDAARLAARLDALAF